MQLPQRRRRSQRREEEVAWRRGLGRDELVRLVAQGALAEVMVAEVGCRRKKKTLQQREKSWKEKREKVTVAALPLVRSWVDGNEGGNPVVEVEVGGSVGCLCGGRKKKMQKKRICKEKREDLAVAVPIAGEDLGS
jgi:hypothetical protein